MSDSLQPHRLYSPWNSPGQNTGVGSRSLLQRIFPTQVSSIACRFLGCVCVCVCVLSCVRLFVVPWTVVHQDLLSVEFSGQEHWCRLPFSTPRDLPDPGIKPEALTSPALAGTLAPLGKPLFRLPTIIFIIVIVSSVACLTRLKSL